MATVAFQLTSAFANGTKTFTSSEADMQLLMDWASAAYAADVQNLTPIAKFTAQISGTTMTVSAVTTGTLSANQYIYGAGVLPTTRISALGTGTGGTGTYTLTDTQTISVDTAMAAFNPLQVGSSMCVATVRAWTQATQKMQKDGSIANVPTPPPMGWA